MDKDLDLPASYCRQERQQSAFQIFLIMNQRKIIYHVLICICLYIIYKRKIKSSKITPSLCVMHSDILDWVPFSFLFNAGFHPLN